MTEMLTHPWAWTAVGSGLLLGLIGSLHCLGMCGPLALALPVGQHRPAGVIVSRLLYHSSRVMAYASLGAVVGLIGTGLGQYQQGLSIAAGATLILLVALPRLRTHIEGRWARVINPAMAPWWQRMRDQPRWWLFVVLGFFNGLIPCGLVYVALASALAQGSLVGAVITMMAFGLGTWPMMLAVSIMPGVTRGWRSPKLQRLLPVVGLVLGVLFILRGMGLGIPYVSPPAQSLTPHTTSDGGEAPHCH